MQNDAAQLQSFTCISLNTMCHVTDEQPYSDFGPPSSCTHKPALAETVTVLETALHSTVAFMLAPHDGSHPNAQRSCKFPVSQKLCSDLYLQSVSCSEF